MSARLLTLVLVFSLTASANAADDDAARIRQRKEAHQPKLSFVESKSLKIGVDLNLGGAITYLSPAGKDDNLVNNWDWGRQIQMSHYGGPSPLKIEGKEPARAWANFGWNPVQAGDHFGNASKLLDSRNDGKEIYVKSRPMQWSYDNVPCACTFETWITVDGPTARVRCRVTNARQDKKQYHAHEQELPALYVNAPYYRLMSYTGGKPFANEKLTRVEKKKDVEPSFPWARFQATENWAALVNDDDFGLGLWQPRCVSFLGGFAGKPGKGGTKDSPTGYLAPIRAEILDHNIVYEHEYVLILGKLADIRATVYQLAGQRALPDWRFANDRQGWTYAGTTDSGWPIKGELNVALESKDAALLSPVACWQAAEAPVVTVAAAFKTAAKQGRIHWATLDDAKFVADRSVSFPVHGDGEYRTYTIRLVDNKNYSGVLTRLRLVVDGAGARGDNVRVRAVTLTREPK